MAVLYNCACNTKQPLRFLDRPMLRLAGLSSSVGGRKVCAKMSVQRNDSRLSRVCNSREIKASARCLLTGIVYQ